jgi:O-antigen ligase
VKLNLLQQKGIYITPILFVLFVFFVPLSPSLKSIFFALGVASVLFNPDYNQYLFYAYNTYWGRIALLFVAFIALACCWSPAPFSIQMSVLSKYSKLIYLPILAVGFINPKTRFWCINAYLLSMVITFFVAILKLNGVVHMGDPTDSGDLFYNHIVTGFMMAIACYLALLYTLKFKGWPRLAYLAVVLITSYQTLFINTGRTGYVMYLILIGLFLIQKLPFKKALVGCIAFCGVVLLAYSLSPIMQEGVHDLITDVKYLQKNKVSTSTGSLGLRLRFHDYAHTLFSKHPIIGIGTGGFQYSYSQDKPIPAWGPILNDPHSQYWMTLSEQGIIGAVFLFLFLGGLLFASFQLKESRSILWGMLVAFCMGALTDSILCYSTAGYLLIIISALCFGEFVENYAMKKKELISPVNLGVQGYKETTGTI